MKKNKEKIIGKILISLIIIEIIFSLYLLYVGVTNETQICVKGESCSEVQNSSYGELFGIQLPYYSLVCFVALILIYFWNKKLFLIGTLLGGLFAIYLIFVQLFVLKKICTTCMMVDIIMLLITTLSCFLYVIKTKKNGR
ncbi:MAG: vitamin K epoxide reductase family protein [Candidatus Pacearchaeota archaeon]|jgi:uncharacterized membrane protein